MVIECRYTITIHKLVCIDVYVYVSYAVLALRRHGTQNCEDTVAVGLVLSFSHNSQVASSGIKSRPQVAPTRANGRCLPPVRIWDVFGSPYLTVGA